jgi:hypothetical protein
VRDFYEYLMLGMAADIKSEWENPSHRAHELCFLLSLDAQPVPETFFKMYSSNLDCTPETVENALAFFTGVGVLSVACDCSPQDKVLCEINSIEDSPFFLKGKQAVRENSEECEILTGRIASVREDLGA